MAIDLTVLGATKIVVGLSQIVRFTPPAYCNGYQFKLITTTAGGTLEIVPPAFSGSSSLAGASGGWGQGYALASNEVVPVQGPAMFYMAASGVTQTVAVMFGFTSGATTI